MIEEYKILLIRLLMLKKCMYLMYKVYILTEWKPKYKGYRVLLKHKKMYLEVEEMIYDVKDSIIRILR